MKSHFCGRGNGLSKVHYFFTEVEQTTKHIVIREIRDNKTRELARAYLTSRDNKKDDNTLIMSSMQL